MALAGGLCECGCGGAAPISPRTIRSRGYIKGQPRRFICGHATRLQLDHLCRVHGCVRPDHLEPVTNAENARRGDNTKLTVDDVRAIRAATGDRAELAAAFGITKAHVGNIRARRRWADV